MMLTWLTTEHFVLPPRLSVTHTPKAGAAFSKLSTRHLPLVFDGQKKARRGREEMIIIIMIIVIIIINSKKP